MLAILYLKFDGCNVQTLGQIFNIIHHVEIGYLLGRVQVEQLAEFKFKPLLGFGNHFQSGL